MQNYPSTARAKNKKIVIRGSHFEDITIETISTHVGRHYRRSIVYRDECENTSHLDQTKNKKEKSDAKWGQMYKISEIATNLFAEFFTFLLPHVSHLKPTIRDDNEMKSKFEGWGLGAEKYSECSSETMLRVFKYFRTRLFHNKPPVNSGLHFI